MTRYAMVIDLKRCYGCYSCQVVCKSEHFTPPGVFWGKIARGEAGRYPSTIRQTVPLLCMHCKEPECEKVCPTKATKRRPDGIVVIDKNLCIGCKYCVQACPYNSRYFVPRWSSYFPDARELSDYEKYARAYWREHYGEGVTTKCNFCLERIEQGLKPACVESCPANARYFGDLDDPESEVSVLIKKYRGFQLNTEFGTDPSVYYLPPR